eukprot:TRINITY_DN2173_c0_g1_i1.p1 TRINITY_DN2173_c0_g1~~TRINITY_DN2173_c0_g1_i1.p1  ORF type:complete len:182 (+),score=63.67 TRINITY_DN2173_c0_g1_i1:177-722(+)
MCIRDRPWRTRKDEEVRDVKQTAVQEYEEMQHTALPDNGHLAGHKFPHDRIFSEEATEIAQQAHKAGQVAQAGLAETVKRLHDSVDAAQAKAGKQQKEVSAGEAATSVLGRVKTVQDVKASMETVSKQLTACRASLESCCTGSTKCGEKWKSKEEPKEEPKEQEAQKEKPKKEVNKEEPKN